MLEIPIETGFVITLVAALVLVLFVVFKLQRDTLTRMRLDHDSDLLALAKELGCEAGPFRRLVAQRFAPYVKKRGAFSFTFVLGVLFWVAVTGAFAWWTLFLMKQAFILLVPIAAVFALVSLVMVFSVWFERRYADKQAARLAREIDDYDALLERGQQAPVVQEREVRRPVAVTEAREKAAVRPPMAVEPALVIPEDSMLRRHFLSHLRAEIETGIGQRPTDSTLRRHYDSMVEAEMERRLGQPLPPPPATQPVSAPATQSLRSVAAGIGEAAAKGAVRPAQVQAETGAGGAALTVPEDSTLRRHFLTQLRADIEDSMAPSPTDFALRRHFDAAVDAELERRLAGGRA